MREALRSIADQDIQASIVVLATPPYTDPRATAPELPRGTGGARYRILRPHAKGGLGEVFVAEDTELHREVALKQIQEQCADDARSRARFLLEAEVNGRLEHPAIVPVYALGQDAGGRPYYVMRFIEGDLAVQLGVLGHEHLAQPALGVRPQHPVAHRFPIAGCQGMPVHGGLRVEDGGQADVGQAGTHLGVGELF